jgi:hypothetical protein
VAKARRRGKNKIGTMPVLVGLDDAAGVWFPSRANRGAPMTAATLIAGEPKLDLGWVIRSTAGVLRRRAGDLVLVSLPFVWIPSVVAGFAPDNRGLQLLSNVPALIFTGAASLITYQELAGGLPVSAGQAIRAGAARFGTLWLIGLASGIMTVLGLLLLVVPGVIAAVGFSTASAVAVVENKNAVPSLERAWNLSRGQRWRLTGLAALLIPVFLGVVLVGAVIGAVLALAGAQSVIDPVADFLVGPIMETFVFAVTTVGTAAAYVGLRTAKEGASDIARTFD